MVRDIDNELGQQQTSIWQYLAQGSFVGARTQLLALSGLGAKASAPWHSFVAGFQVVALIKCQGSQLVVLINYLDPSFLAQQFRQYPRFSLKSNPGAWAPCFNQNARILGFHNGGVNGTQLLVLIKRQSISSLIRP